MAYRFRLSEAFDHGVRRVGLQQIDRAIADLETLQDAELAVHGTRKGLKRIRALLRLARPALEPAEYRHENRCFRDIGRILARARDRHVLAKTLERLEEATKGQSKLAFKAALKQLAEQNEQAPNAVDERTIRRALAELKAARKRFERMVIHSRCFETGFDGLKASYGQAVKTFAAASESGDTEDIHEWRKRVQHHFRHLMLMSEASPEVFGARIETARALAASLGEDHDIAMVLAAVGDDGSLKVSAAHRRAIEEFVSGRRKVLWADAQATGRTLFSDKPRTFREKVKRHWDGAQAAPAKVRSPA